MQAKSEVLRRSVRQNSQLEWVAMTPFVLMHIAVFGALWSGVSSEAALFCVAAYLVRMFAVTGIYHRYFSHRTFKTSRFMQFVFAFLAETTLQRGVLWWAAHHRDHHKYSDKEEDVHSPRQRGLFYAHVGWIYDHNSETKIDRIRDFAKYPELVWLDRHWVFPSVVLGVVAFATLGWSGLFIGYCLSTVLLWHGTFAINSLAHVWGKRRYATSDDSRNNFWLALVTLGEGWHNNHHHYMHSTRQGFFWWELDITYYVLRVMAALGLVWELKEPPAWALAGHNSARELLTQRGRSAPAAGSGDAKRVP